MKILTTGHIIGKALKEIDQNKEENFNHLKETLKELTPEDSFLRGMAINLVNQLNLSGEDKVALLLDQSLQEKSFLMTKDTSPQIHSILQHP